MLTKEEFVRTHPDVRVGMTAYTLEGEKLGVIKRIDDDNLRIERGWFFHKDFVIPYDDIEDIRADQVIVRQRRADFEEETRSESWDTGESDLTGRASEMGQRAAGHVKEAGKRFGERIKETGERLGERAKEVSGYRGRAEEKTRIPVREEELEAQKRAKESEVAVRKEVRKEDVKVAPSKPVDEEKE